MMDRPRTGIAPHSNRESGWDSHSAPVSASQVSERPAHHTRLLAVLERGLRAAHQAHYADAALHFALARKELTDDGDPLVAALDAVVDSHAKYWQAQQTLHASSHSFVLADADQQAHLSNLERLLSKVLVELPDSPPLTGAADLEPSPALWSPPQATDGAHQALPGLDITCFGRFDVYRSGKHVDLCANRNGQAILRYLVAQPLHRETMDVLMETFWPQDRNGVARHKLHVAVSALRCALNGDRAPEKGVGYLMYEREVYHLNPDVDWRIDVQQFEAAYQAGRNRDGDEMIAHYRRACQIYTGPFLPEDVYSDWSLIRREQLTQIYLEMCQALATTYLQARHYKEAAAWANKILQENRCDEAAHRLLMEAYAADGRRADALRQYRLCEEILRAELGIAPMAETTALFYAILQGQPYPRL